MFKNKLFDVVNDILFLKKNYVIFNEKKQFKVIFKL